MLGNSNKKSTANGDDNSTGQLNRLTELADLLLGRGDTNIYEMSREGIVLSDVSGATVLFFAMWVDERTFFFFFFVD